MTFLITISNKNSFYLKLDINIELIIRISSVYGLLLFIKFLATVDYVLLTYPKK